MGETRGRTAAPRYGEYIVLQGQRLSLTKHPTDFSLIGRSAALSSALCEGAVTLSRNMQRVTTAKADDATQLMAEARQDSVAHHIYRVDGTTEEIVIDDRILLTLRHVGTGILEGLLQEFHLILEGRMGRAYVLRVTETTGRNPLKVANEIAERSGVEACYPQVLLALTFHQQPPLFPEQWYLTADLIADPDLLPDADIQAPEAWQITTGHPDIVVAVIDDGFDLGHPALQATRLHPARFDFNGQDTDPNAEDRIVNGVNEGDYHGTPVSSIAVGAHTGSAMRGIAPDCTFLPIRIGFGPLAPPIDILQVFRYVSQHADVVNCSFGTPPSSFDRMGREFRAEITRLTEMGGRRGKGLVMVFSAANDDAPTFLTGNQNVHGVKFTSGHTIAEIPAGQSVFSGYPMTEGVVVVGAMSSLKRKAGYSSWGPHLTVTAPLNNLHYIMAFASSSDPRRAAFVTRYRGRGQVAATNRPGHGAPFAPIQRVDDPMTPALQENFYTKLFGGISGAAPVVTGIVGLMLAANPELTATQVRQILMATADTDLDVTLDLANDPNVQGLSGAFVNGRSLFFGSGKVNAFKAVSRARALASGDGAPGPSPLPQEYHGEARPGLPIPDNKPEGIVSAIALDGIGKVASISVSVDITHTWRGDLKVTLIAPNGMSAELHRFSGGSTDDLRQTYNSHETAELGQLVRSGIDVRGDWALHVADYVRRDVGSLNAWSLTLRTI